MASFGLLRQPSTILLGRGQRAALVDHLPRDADNVLIVTDARMALQPEFIALAAAVRLAASVTVIADVRPELPVDDVIAAARGLAGNPPDAVIAVGGGSVIDFAKVLALLVTHGGRPQDYYGEFAVPGPTIPLIAIPTTAGTGSEATPIAVLTDPERQMKIGISSPHLIPLVAICDPELSDSAPPALAASAGADALSHCIESFTAIVRDGEPGLSTQRVSVGSNVLSDQWALAGITAIGRSLRAVVNGHPDAAVLSQARDDLVFAALAGGLSLGTGGAAAAHALQYPVGAATHTPHGVGVGVLLPYVMEFNRPARIAAFATVARALGHEGTDDEQASRVAVDLVAELLDDIGIPTTLKALGVAESSVHDIAEQGAQAGRLVNNNPRALDIKALELITSAAWHGDRSRVAGGR